MSRWRRRTQRVWLNPRHGEWLTALVERTGVELAWATTWGHRANQTVGPAIGLPELPVVEFAGPHADHLPAWKFPAVARFAHNKPLAWLDDDFDLRPAARDDFLLRRRDTPTLLVPIDPRVGMVVGDLDVVEAWVTTV